MNNTAEETLKEFYEHHKNIVKPDGNWADWETCKNDGTLTMVVEAMESYASSLSSEVDRLRGELAEAQHVGDWTPVKPEFKEECAFVTATFTNGEWERQLWQLVWADGHNDKGDEARYLSLCCEDGEEWGPLEDLKPDLYYILPSPPKE